MSAGAARPLSSPQARGRGNAVGAREVRCPGSPPWASQGPRRRPGAPLGRALRKSAGGETAEAKRRQFERLGRTGEEGLPCSTGRSPSWPGPPGLGRLCPGTQHHSSPSHRRPPSFWAAITGPPEKSQRPDVRGVTTPAARLWEARRAAAEPANPEPTFVGGRSPEPIERWE